MLRTFYLTFLLFAFVSLAQAQTADELFKQGVSLMDDGKYDDAIASLNEAVNKDKNNTTYLLKRGEAKFKAGKAILAIQDFNKVIQLDEKNSMAYAWRSTIYVDLKDFKSAISDCQKALELDPKNELAYIRMGDSYFYQESKDYLEAMKSYNYAININSNNKVALHNRGVIKKELKDYVGAIDDFNKAIIIDAEYGSAYMARGICKSLIGDTPGACIDWYLAGEMGQTEAQDYISQKCNQ